MLQRAARLSFSSQLTSLTSIANGSCAYTTTHLGTSSPSPTKLDDVLKLDTLVDKSAAEIEQIWMQFHLDENTQRAGAVIQRQIWDTISFRAKSALGPSAPPAASVTHYTELAKSHGLILSRADVLQPHVVSVPEARTLMALLHVFYSDPDSFLHVHRFNHEPDSFDYDSLLAELGHPTGM